MNVLKKVLELVFKNTQGATKTLRVSDPKEGVSAAEANAAMEEIIASEAFEAGGDLATAVEARLRFSDVTVLQ